MSETVTISTKRFSDLSLEELYGILRVRSEVFVTGKKCLYVDPDGKDLDSVQVFASEGDRIIGCLRPGCRTPGWMPPKGYGIGVPRDGRNDPCPCGSDLKYKVISYWLKNTD